MKQYLLLYALLCVSATTLAQAPGNDTLQQIELDTITVSVPAGPAPYRASSPRLWEIIHTRVALSFNRQEKTAAAREWVKLRPYCYATDTIVLDAKGMAIDSVMLAGKKGNRSLRYTYLKDELKIWLDKQYLPTDTIGLYFRYTALPYAQKSGGSTAISDDKGLYFINTDGQSPSKPAHIWTQGETESNSHWMITIDKPNTRFTVQLELLVPDTLTTLSNGALITQVKSTGGMRTDIWRIDMPIQAYAVMFAIGKYTVVKDKWRNKEVSYYVEPQYGPYARQMFINTPEMMEFFSTRTGVPYPWNKYSQVAVRDYVSGAMENTTASLFGEFINQTKREMADRDYEDIVAHELFHQWFGDYVTCESWSNLTVSESFANYGEQLWRAAKHGRESGDELAWNDLQIYLGSSRSHDPELVRFRYDSREDMFDAISYNKGGAILRHLNFMIGDAAFDNAMKLYLTRNALRSAEAHQWRLAVEEATGLDWNWFFDQWYYHKGHPELKVTYDYSDSAQTLSVKTEQVQDDSDFLYRLPLKAAVIYGNSLTVVDWNISKRTETWTIPYKNGEKPVVIPDFTHVLPGDLRDGKKPAQWLAQYLISTGHINKRLAVVAAAKQLSDSASQVVIDLSLKDTMASIRRLAVGQLTRAQSDKYRKRWTPVVMALATTDPDNRVRAEAFDILGTWKVGKAKGAMLAAVWDSSYVVAANALEALEKLDKDTAYVLAKLLQQTHPRGALDGAVWGVIGKKGADEDIVLYKTKAATVFGSKTVTFALTLNSYLKTVQSVDAFSEAVNLYAALVRQETMKSYRQALGGFMFQAVTEQKNRQKDDNKDIAACATARLVILKKALQTVVDEEKEAEVKKKFTKMMKDNFE